MDTIRNPLHRLKRMLSAAFDLPWRDCMIAVLVLISALATDKLWTRLGGLFALVTLALIWH